MDDIIYLYHGESEGYVKTTRKEHEAALEKGDMDACLCNEITKEEYEAGIAEHAGITDIVFVCLKCEHNLFIGLKDRTLMDLAEILTNRECDGCGSVKENQWAFNRLGNFDVEVGNEN